MSIFKNVSFVNEGEQAEAYKARKEAERDKIENEDKERFERRYGNSPTGNKYRTDQYLDKHDRRLSMSKSLGDLSRSTKAKSKMYDYEESDQFDQRQINAALKAGFSKSEIDTMKKMQNSDSDHADEYFRNLQNTNKYKEFLRHSGRGEMYDAANRHIRRHPDQYKESTIFESVQFLND